MTQEEWNNATRNSMFARMQSDAYPRRAISNGYSTASPTYNPYSMQFRRTDYNQPVQRYQTPPINQALTLTPIQAPQNQAEYVRRTDYNGIPVTYPSNAPSQLIDSAGDIANSVIDWAKENTVQKVLMGGGALAPFLLNKSPLTTAQAQINASPKLQSMIATLAAMRLGAPIVSGMRTFVNNPYVQKADKAIGKVIDWF